MDTAKAISIKMLGDAIGNTLTGQGGSNDADAHNSVGHVDISYQEAHRLYRNYWLGRKIVDIPVFDMLRNGRTFHEMDKKDEELYRRAWKKLRCNQAIAKGLRLSRIVGGSGIIPVSADMDLDKPREARNYVNGRLKRFVTLDAYQLTPRGSDINMDIRSPYYNLPKHFHFRAQTIDASNVIIVQGHEMPNPDDFQDTMGISKSWGGSMYNWNKEPVMRAHATEAIVGSILARNNTDYLKVPNLYDELIACGSDGDQTKILEGMLSRVLMMARFRSQHNVVILDDKESVERLTYNLAGLADLLTKAINSVAGSSDIPMMRLFGETPSGLNSTGASDLENYYANVGSQQVEYLEPTYDQMDEFMTLAVFGETREIKYTINSPNVVSDAQQTERTKQQTETISAISDMNIVPESYILRALQQGPMPEIEDVYIESVIAAERNTDEDDLDEPDDLDDPDGDEPDDLDGDEGDGAA